MNPPEPHTRTLFMLCPKSLRFSRQPSKYRNTRRERLAEGSQRSSCLVLPPDMTTERAFSYQSSMEDHFPNPNGTVILFRRLTQFGTPNTKRPRGFMRAIMKCDGIHLTVVA